MSENVFNVAQIGRQSGTFDSPGAAVAASVLYPMSESISPDLELGSAYPAMDRGRNVRNRGGSGYHGIRQASVTLPSEVRFEDVMLILEMIYAGGVTPSAGVWHYPFETGAPSVVPCTIETGNIDDTAAQERLVSTLVGSLTIGFSAITAGQASPWTLSAELLAFDREVSPLTAGLDALANPDETVQGHLTQVYLGAIDEAFDALTTFDCTLRSWTMTAQRSLALRSYGGTDDKACKFGYTELSNATYEMMVAVSPDTKTELHDAWNTSGATIGEKRIRVQAAGSSSKLFTVDGRIGLFAIPWDDSDGERVYRVTGEFADDDELDASHAIDIANSITSLEAYS